MHGEVVQRQTAGERGGDARVVDDFRHLKGEMMTVSVTAEVKRMYFRINKQTRATAVPMSYSGGEGELVIMPMVMPIMSKPAMSSVVKDMGESSSMNNPGCT